MQNIADNRKIDTIRHSEDSAYQDRIIRFANNLFGSSSGMNMQSITGISHEHVWHARNYVLNRRALFWAYIAVFVIT